MHVPDLIRRKRDGEELADEEIEELVQGYVRGVVPDYQMAAFLMAVYFQGMNERETAALTRAMVRSGGVVDLSSVPGVKLDKHSTGGVADTTTLVLLPLVASAGVAVAKMSGRGLGYTGGTIDKLESVPGFRTHLSAVEFVAQVRRIGLALTAQSGELTPADQQLYALRDVTATVESPALIASSVMSKKIAGGADKIVLDVKVGRGALLPDERGARDLAERMVRLGERMGREVTAFLTDMDQPLGLAIGNALEVIEAVEVLQGKAWGELRELSVAIGAEMVRMAGVEVDAAEALRLLEAKLDRGEALDMFRRWIEAQGGDGRVAEDPRRFLPKAAHVRVVTAAAGGYIQDIDPKRLGRLVQSLGAGRRRKEDVVDLSVGVVLGGKVGDRIRDGEPLAVIHARSLQDLDLAEREVRSAIILSRDPVPRRPVILDRISHGS
ncbi:MAG: thymidine phosphorylase [Kyrpidia tusciae]|nr:thymidine phosphorylase [Kyrpidia tusciae]MBE3552947.1 thymidine phosphorylase [Kyrpidia tusciae]